MNKKNIAVGGNTDGLENPELLKGSISNNIGVERQTSDEERKIISFQKKKIYIHGESPAEELPDPPFDPLEDRLIVIADRPKEKTESGIIISEAHQERHVPSRGTVVAVGPGSVVSGNALLMKIYQAICKASGQEPDLNAGMPYKRGDRVMYGHYAGTEIDDPKNEHQKYLIMRSTDVFIKLRPGE
jgi:co-chaperonin GroES (HSP10)